LMDPLDDFYGEVLSICWTACTPTITRQTTASRTAMLAVSILRSRSVGNRWIWEPNIDRTDHIEKNDDAAALDKASMDLLLNIRTAKAMEAPRRENAVS